MFLNHTFYDKKKSSNSLRKKKCDIEILNMIHLCCKIYAKNMKSQLGSPPPQITILQNFFCTSILLYSEY